MSHKPARPVRRKVDKLLAAMKARAQGEFTFTLLSGDERRAIGDGQGVTIGGRRIAWATVRRCMHVLYMYRWASIALLTTLADNSAAIAGLIFSLLPDRIRKEFRGRWRIFLLGTRPVFAGCDRPSKIEAVAKAGGEAILVNYQDALECISWPKAAEKHGLLVMMDSQGHKDWKEGVEVTDEQLHDVVRKYASALEKFRDVVCTYVQPDIMGDQVRTRRLLEMMLDNGLTPMPVFQAGSDWSFLDELIAEGWPVIALGGLLAMNVAERLAYLEEVHRRYPSQAFHALGLGSPHMIPGWLHSADGATWLKESALNKRIPTRWGSLPVADMPCSERMQLAASVMIEGLAADQLLDGQLNFSTEQLVGTLVPPRRRRLATAAA